MFVCILYSSILNDSHLQGTVIANHGEHHRLDITFQIWLEIHVIRFYRLYDILVVKADDPTWISWDHRYG